MHFTCFFGIEDLFLLSLLKQNFIYLPSMFNNCKIYLEKALGETHNFINDFSLFFFFLRIMVMNKRFKLKWSGLSIRGTRPTHLTWANLVSFNCYGGQGRVHAFETWIFLVKCRVSGFKLPKLIDWTHFIEGRPNLGFTTHYHHRGRKVMVMGGQI